MVFKIKRMVYTGKPKTAHMEEVERFPHDYKFGFDIESPRQAKLWMRHHEHKHTGKLLPRETENGFPYAYSLVQVGGPYGAFVVFPGHDMNGGSFPVWYYGRLDIENCLDNVNEPLLIDEQIMRRDINTKHYEREFIPTPIKKEGQDG